MTFVSALCFQGVNEERLTQSATVLLQKQVSSVTAKKDTPGFSN
ncbi:hypothetical protein [Endozoicomonas montiporae]|nr:hypothetical protein [Endozoicomonas montiporae]